CEPARQLATQLIFVWVLRLHQPDLQTMSGTHDPVTIRDELVFTIFRGNTEQRLPCAACTGARNVIAAIGQFYTQKSNGYVIDVGTIAKHRDRSGSGGKCAVGCAQPRPKIRCITVVRDGIQDRRRRTLTRDAVKLSRTLIAAEEKYLVLHNRSTNRTAELVLPQYLFVWRAGTPITVIEKIVRIQGLVAEELKQRSVKFVAATLGHDVYVGSGVPAITRIVSRCLNFEFLNCIGIGNCDAGVKTRVGGFVITRGIVDRHAVHLEIVLLWISAVHAHVFGTFSEGGPVIRCDGNTCKHSQHSRQLSVHEPQLAH